ncbi:UNVERIFIED_CONTAM: hypothetical protein GTU68_054570 [Idotea baltica]|nr:hypothetical protein [Idotea baltica]
MCQQKIKK